MEAAKGECPYCKHKFFYYNPNEYFYGSPIRTCKKCQQQYIDKRYHEIAVEDESSKKTATTKSAAISLVTCLLIGGFFIYRAFCLFGSYHRQGTIPTNDILAIMFGIIGILCIIGGIVHFIDTLTGAAQRRMDKRLHESEERLKNRLYAQTLKSVGYSVPDKYL